MTEENKERVSSAHPTTTNGPALQALRVHGMDCAEEVAILKRALSGVVEADALRFDTLAGIMEVPAEAKLNDIVEAVAATGMRAQPLTPGAPASESASWWEKNRLTTIVVASGIGTLGGFVVHGLLSGFAAAVGSEGMSVSTHSIPAAAAALYLVAVLAGLALVVPKALYAARSFRPDMNLLMTLAVAGAVGIGEWFEAATVSFLFALSLALEAWSVSRARNAVEKLLSLTPTTVRVRRGDSVTDVHPDEVEIGAVVLVKPGERFGLDGQIVVGETEVDQAPITGESLPVRKAPGDEVFAGTINGNAAVDIRTTALAPDTALARIIQMVGEARRDRSDSERWVERFARVYTPVVFVIALFVFVGPPVAFGGDWGEWFYSALVLLVIGCPCALVISTPVAVVAGLAASARHGVLVKGGRFLEIPAALKVVALDKTGTLTLGKLRVVDVHPLDDHTEEALLAAAAAIEADSEHPIAHAVMTHAHERGVEIPRATSVEIVPGKGTTGVVRGRNYWLGSHRWLEDRRQETTEVHERLQRSAEAGKSIVVMGTDDHVCGFLKLADGIRPDAKDAVHALHDAGIVRVAMLTGDNATTAALVGTAVGIDDVRAELMPEEKVAAVVELENEIGPVAMIGDGVNDAPALARASLGVAMGALGTDVAVETADVALMTDDLSKLAWLVTHSKRTLAIIRQNTVFALGIKALFVVLTFSGLASLWGAIAADMGASLLVVFNALRLLDGGAGIEGRGNSGPGTPSTALPATQGRR